MSWRDRFGEEVTCVRCLEVRDTSDVDRLLWCRSCLLTARRRATRRGWVVGISGALLLVLWIWWAVRPTDLVWGGWAATVVAAAWIGARAAREVFFGVERVLNRRAAEAVPPAVPDA
ncbi:MAG: hypothetical protein KJO11_14755 [Gemmatimonadetes bacterium]|nr:hypothetical protein [Gemmatimonadota bacterium]NNK64040.1 hypothetical protein [Gemmatimonadota bacterium]